MRREEGHIRTRGQGFQRFFYRFENRKIRATHCAEKEGGPRDQGFLKKYIKTFFSATKCDEGRGMPHQNQRSMFLEEK